MPRTVNWYLLPKVCCTKPIQKWQYDSRLKPLHLITVTQPLVQVDATLEPWRFFFIIYLKIHFEKSQKPFNVNKYCSNKKIIKSIYNINI